jgi:hypothetical protein
MLVACVLFCAWNAMALGPTMLGYPRSITVTTDTLVQSWPGTDSLVVELPYRLWTKTPVHIVSGIIEIEWIEIDTGLGQNCRVVEVDTGFHKESLKRRVEYVVTFFDNDGNAVSRGRHIADPMDYVPREFRNIITCLEPTLFATASGPMGRGEGVVESTPNQSATRYPGHAKGVDSGRPGTKSIRTMWAGLRKRYPPPTRGAK